MVFEEILAFIQTPAVLAFVTIFGRNIYGWLNRSLEDGKLDAYEWKQLGKTLLQLGGFSIFAWFGINTLVPGLLDLETATALTAFVDVIRSYLK